MCVSDNHCLTCATNRLMVNICGRLQNFLLIILTATHHTCNTSHALEKIQVFQVQLISSGVSISWKNIQSVSKPYKHVSTPCKTSHAPIMMQHRLWQEKIRLRHLSDESVWHNLLHLGWRSI